jgi:hypothetical protein
MKFNLSYLSKNTVWQVYRIRDRILLDPDYQRLGEIWTKEKKQLLLDSLINGFDIPKFYLHKFDKPKTYNKKEYDYAIVDGKQRLETIWSFIKGELSLDDELVYFADEGIDIKGLKYNEFANKAPDLKSDFDGISLDVVCIETDEIEMIEEMFSRLNEAAPLNAAEKRNALGGPVPVAIRSLVTETFFAEKVPFSNRRYRQFDLACKFLYFESNKKVLDTKKLSLDNFVEQFKSKPRNRKLGFAKLARQNLENMSDIFAKSDPLLKQVGMIIVYYNLFRLALEEGWETKITRGKLVKFNKLRKENRITAELDIKNAEFDLIEFDRYALSLNDSHSIKTRVQILAKFAFDREIDLDRL